MPFADGNTIYFVKPRKTSYPINIPIGRMPVRIKTEDGKRTEKDAAKKRIFASFSNNKRKAGNS
jgi:hypothetical protein